MMRSIVVALEAVKSPFNSSFRKEAKGIVHSLAQRMNQETSTPSKASPLYGEDAIASEGKPLSGKVLVWLAKPVPFGRAMIII